MSLNIDTPWGAAINAVSGIIGKLIPDKAAQAAAQAQLQILMAQGSLNEEMAQLTSVTSAQSDINKVEASSQSTFVAGWRPMIGWVCATALGYQYIIKPVVMAGFSIAHYATPVMPGIDDQLWQLMFGMLGMGALRSFDKIKGVETNQITKK